MTQSLYGYIWADQERQWVRLGTKTTWLVFVGTRRSLAWQWQNEKMRTLKKKKKTDCQKHE